MNILTEQQTAARGSSGIRALRRSQTLACAVLAAALASCGGSEPACCEPPIQQVPALSISTGDEQVAALGAALPLPLVAVLRGASGPVAGTTVQWTVQTGATVAPASVVTGADGLAATTATPTSVGVARVQASVTGGSAPTVFTAFGVPVGAAVVRVGNNFFEPTQVTIARGGSVAWVWRGSSSNHNVVPVGDVEPASSGGPQGGPALYTHTFGAAGSYRYRCTPHSGMDGTVVVN